LDFGNSEGNCEREYTQAVQQFRGIQQHLLNAGISDPRNLIGDPLR